jgi:hypothetical protein
MTELGLRASKSMNTVSARGTSRKAIPHGSYADRVEAPPAEKAANNYNRGEEFESPRAYLHFPQCLRRETEASSKTKAKAARKSVKQDAAMLAGADLGGGGTSLC